MNLGWKPAVVVAGRTTDTGARCDERAQALTAWAGPPS